MPFNTFATYQPDTAPLSVNHQSQFPATTLTFNLRAGASLSDGVTAVDAAMRDLGVPATVHGSFQGTAQASSSPPSPANRWLILGALATVYIVLGVLYESLIHPFTILSTLPSAGLGATLALLLCRTEFTIIALIGVILLIGIVKKNAIMMIDFALDAERTRGLDADGCDSRGVPASLPPDPHDDDGRDARRVAHGPGNWRRRRSCGVRWGLRWSADCSSVSCSRSTPRR